MRDGAVRRALVVASSVRVLHVGIAAFTPLAVPSVVRWPLLVVGIAAGVLRLVPAEHVPARLRHVLVSALALLSVSVISAGWSGGLASIAFAGVLVGAADVGVQRGGGTGSLVGGGAVLLTLVLDVAFGGGGEAITPVEAWVLLASPLVGLAFGTAHRDLPVSGAVALRATNVALDELVRLTERLPAGLDLWSVADAILAELREEASAAGAEQPHLLIGRSGVLHGVGRPWDRAAVGLVEDLPRGRSLRTFAWVERGDLPPQVATRLHGPRWQLHRLGSEGGHGAVLLPAALPTAAMAGVQSTLRTGVVALANVERFGRLQAVAVDAARERLAHDLHDGVAQALTHVRFELELLALAQDGELASELQRIRGAADAALLEVRRTVGELRDHGTLADAITAHVDAVRSFARCSIELTVTGAAELGDELRDDLFRVAQEALSNALRHGGADHVELTLELDEQLVRLTVEDDGRGIAPDAEPGVGLLAMRQRAARHGGRVDVRPRRGGGTVVDLEVPADSAPTARADRPDGAVPADSRTDT